MQSGMMLLSKWVDVLREEQPTRLGNKTGGTEWVDALAVEQPAPSVGVGGCVTSEWEVIWEVKLAMWSEEAASGCNERRWSSSFVMGGISWREIQSDTVFWEEVRVYM